MVKIGVISIVYALINNASCLFAQTDTISAMKPMEFEEVQVTGKRSQVVTSEISRVVTVIRKDEIEKSGLQNVADLLEYVSNVDVRQRGNYGIQSDLSIRGSSFDHVMILINGINLSDPQTGHFSMDLPLDPENIERIEILEGTASRILGPGAFAGAINIVTHTGSSQNVYVSETFGNHCFRKDHLHAGLRGGITDHFLSVGHLGSDGFMRNTDFSIYNAYYRMNVPFKAINMDLQSGYQNKKFGAGGFYSARFPDQYEENSTWFTSIKGTTGKKIIFSPQIYWRRKKDHFLLDRGNPAFYKNYHLTDVVGGQISSSLRLDHSVTSFGMDIRYENIWSNNLGFPVNQPKPVRGTDSAFYTRQYDRINTALFFEYFFEYRRLGVTTGVMLGKNTAFRSAPFFFPGLDLSFRLSDHVLLFSSVNRALHLPTFTDLFYVDPQHSGNLKLSPNTIYAYEGGLKYHNPKAMFRVAVFFNKGKNITDWLWSFKGNKYSPIDLDHYQSAGMSLSFQLESEPNTLMAYLYKNIKLNYIFLNVKKSISDSVSKYYNLKHKLSILLSQSFLKNGDLTWKVSFQDRYGASMTFNELSKQYFSVPYHPFWLLDINAQWSFQYMKIFAELSNALDKKYIDTGSAIQEGRNIKVGLAINFKFREK